MAKTPWYQKAVDKCIDCPEEVDSQLKLIWWKFMQCIFTGLGFLTRFRKDGKVTCKTNANGDEVLTFPYEEITPTGCHVADKEWELGIDDSVRAKFKGDKGDTGPAGINGTNGQDGINGTNGQDGADGKGGIVVGEDVCLANEWGLECGSIADGEPLFQDETGKLRTRPFPKTIFSEEGNTDIPSAKLLGVTSVGTIEHGDSESWTYQNSSVYDVTLDLQLYHRQTLTGNSAAAGQSYTEYTLVCFDKDGVQVDTQTKSIPSASSAGGAGVAGETVQKLEGQPVSVALSRWDEEAQVPCGGRCEMTYRVCGMKLIASSAEMNISSPWRVIAHENGYNV